MAAVILAFAMTGCIALSAVSDLVSNFLSLVVMVIARIILQFCDLIMNPLLEITQMTTEEVAHYIPGFAMSGNGIGGYFSQAIMVISTTIAGALIAVRIISYLMETADGARTESVPKLIWNAVFGMVLTLTGSHFLQLMFDEIISPLTTALSEGVTGGGLGEFSFEDSGMKIIGQTESGDAAGTIVAWMGGFSIVEGASLVVSIVFLFLIWWNLIKLVLECAERYIICVFTILLSPLAFATATNERTKDTAVNWMQIGRIQVTRVSVDPDTGITQWRIMQKLDADGNVPETPDVMNIERSAKYNKQTRRYEPETFESIARQLGKVDDYESVGPDTDESYKRRNRNSSQDRTQSAARSNSQPQQKNAYEGKSFRESNFRNERNNRFQQMMQGNKNRNGSKNKKDKPSK